MARKPLKGEFAPKNPAKYIGTYPITFRSSWEQTAMHFFDSHPSILGWSSESVSIPYQNPLIPTTTSSRGKWSMYVPDFLIIYQDKNGKKHCEMIEIKPLKETPGFNEGKVSTRTKLTQVINQAKWQAAAVYCRQRGWSFRIMTEKDLFGPTKRSK